MSDSKLEADNPNSKHTHKSGSSAKYKRKGSKDFDEASKTSWIGWACVAFIEPLILLFILVIGLARLAPSDFFTHPVDYQTSLVPSSFSCFRSRHCNCLRDYQVGKWHVCLPCPTFQDRSAANSGYLKLVGTVESVNFEILIFFSSWNQLDLLPLSPFIKCSNNDNSRTGAKKPSYSNAHRMSRHFLGLKSEHFLYKISSMVDAHFHIFLSYFYPNYRFLIMASWIFRLIWWGLMRGARHISIAHFSSTSIGATAKIVSSRKYLGWYDRDLWEKARI